MAGSLHSPQTGRNLSTVGKLSPELVSGGFQCVDANVKWRYDCC